LDTLQAAILIEKLKHLDQYCTKKQEVASSYDLALGDLQRIQIPGRNRNSTHVFHQYTLLVEGRNELKSYLNDHGIPSMIYYPVPQHLQEAYKNYGYKEGSFPVSERLCKQVLSIPVHTHMKPDQINHICKIVTDWTNG